ncbi:MAG: FadR family transcriptional regulator [Alphaproteobacteria bacterium]|nr:FadR family transcriptional regulator [Alphaproteobacteria bacterium]
MQDAASPLRGNLKSAVAEIIALRILDGSYPPGSTLPTEADLLADLGVSRTCLREALQTLVGKGPDFLAPEASAPACALRSTGISSTGRCWPGAPRSSRSTRSSPSSSAFVTFVEPEGCGACRRHADDEAIAAMREALDAMGPPMASAIRNPERGRAFPSADACRQPQRAVVRPRRLHRERAQGLDLDHLGSARQRSDRARPAPAGARRHRRPRPEPPAEMAKLMSMTRKILKTAKALPDA